MISIEQTLKTWRKNQRFSQLQMSLQLGVSSKHISFLETGRALPSREMLLRIATFLRAPKHEINQALLLAGHAPAYQEFVEDEGELQPVKEAIDHILNNHMPYPALVLNRDWDLITVNPSAEILLIHLGSDSKNLVEIMMETTTKEIIVDWENAALGMIQRLRNELSLQHSFTSRKPSRVKELEASLSAQLSFPDKFPNPKDIVNSTSFRISGQVLSFFSIIAEMSTVQDLRMSELRVEMMFPSNPRTRDFYEG